LGGGRNHRFNLSDGILIKDNHIATLRAHGMTLNEIVAKAKLNAPKGVKVEVEVTNLKEVGEAVSAGADIIMFDNMSLAQMRRAVKNRTGQHIYGGFRRHHPQEFARSCGDRG